MVKLRSIPPTIVGILIFLVFIVAFSFVQPEFTKLDSILWPNQEYISTDASNLRDRPAFYEGKKVSSGSDFKAIFINETTNETFIELKGQIILKVNSSDSHIQAVLQQVRLGNFLYFRGICRITSEKYIEVIELKLQSNSDRLVVYGFSAFGFAGFLFLFFLIYKIDLKQFAIVPKRITHRKYSKQEKQNEQSQSNYTEEK